MREKNPRAPSETPYDFVMMALVASEDEGLLVLPTHRVVRSLAPCSKEIFFNRLKDRFDFLPSPPEKLFEALSTRPPDEKVFGAIFGAKESFVIRVKNLEAIHASLPQAKPAIWYEMEVNLLSHFVFDVLWGVPEERRRNVVKYTHFSGEAVQAVQSGKAEVAFLLRPPAVDTVRELAYAGERLPQKTTYFYPKLASGLFFYHQG